MSIEIYKRHIVRVIEKKSNGHIWIENISKVPQLNNSRLARLNYRKWMLILHTTFYLFAHELSTNMKLTWNKYLKLPNAEHEYLKLERTKNSPTSSFLIIQFEGSSIEILTWRKYVYARDIFANLIKNVRFFYRFS